jgi:hypothetical protein
MSLRSIITSMTKRNEQHSRQMVRADYVKRVQRAWSLRVAGTGWDEIAELTGYSSRQNVIRAVQRYTGTLPTVDAESLRLLSRERGEFLWAHASEEVQRSKGGPAAVRAATDVLRHQASIDGLTQQTVRVQTDPTPEEMHRWAEALLQSVGMSLPQAEADIFAPEYADVQDADLVEEDDNENDDDGPDDPLAPVHYLTARAWSPDEDDDDDDDQERGPDASDDALGIAEDGESDNA